MRIYYIIRQQIFNSYSKKNHNILGYILYALECALFKKEVKPIKAKPILFYNLMSWSVGKKITNS